MLWWLLLLLIPLVVHLFNFRRYKTVLFSNTQFLQKIENQTKRLKQLKRYLLLSSRIGLFSCLILAFCIPYCGKQVEKSLPQQYAVVIDNTYSVDKSLELAKNQARALITQTGSKDKVTLITASNIPKTYIDKAALLKDIDAIGLMPNPITLNSLKQTIGSLNSNGTINLNTFIISDFQKNFIGSYDKKDSWVNTWFVPVEQKTKSNISIDSIYFTNPFGVNNNNYEMECIVTNHGDEEVSQIPLNLYVNKKLLASASINLPAKKTTKTLISYSYSGNEAMEGVVKLDREDLFFDNELFWFHKQQKKKQSIAFIGARNNFIDAVYKTETSFEVNSFNNIPDNLLPYDAIIINGYVSGLDNNSALRNFVEKGGNVLLIPSAAGNSQNDFSNLGVNNWSFSKVVSQKISKIDFKHPLYQFVYKSIPKNPIYPNVNRAFSISTQGNGRTVLGLDDESPVLIDFSLGLGHVYQSAIPLDKSWSDFPLVGYLFYPTISNIAMGNKAQKPLFGWLDENSNVEIDNLTTTGIERFELQNESNAVTAEIMNRTGKTYLFPSTAVLKADIYKIKNALNNKVLGHVALNVNRTESNIEFFNGSQLIGIASNIGADVYENTLSTHPVLAKNRGVIDTSWKWFIVFALLFVLIEIFLLRFI